jgi:hypothetical protein
VRTALDEKLAWLNKFNESIVAFDKTLAELGNYIFSQIFSDGLKLKDDI